MALKAGRVGLHPSQVDKNGMVIGGGGGDSGKWKYTTEELGGTISVEVLAQESGVYTLKWNFDGITLPASPINFSDPILSKLSMSVNGTWGAKAYGADKTTYIGDVAFATSKRFGMLNNVNHTTWIAGENIHSIMYTSINTALSEWCTIGGVEGFVQQNDYE